MKTLHVAFGVLFCLFTFSLDAFAYSGGDGSASRPFQIANIDDLLELAEDTDNYHKCFILTENIDLAGQTFYRAVIAPDTNISSQYFQGTVFTGTFDGNNHTIDHLLIQGVTYLGLFGKLSNATVTNLVIQNAEIYGTNIFGSLAGQNNEGTISNCSVSGLLDGMDESYCFGGLVGINEGTITNCLASCTITGLASCCQVGGLAGCNDNGAILENCSSSGSLTVGNSSYSLGGLAGKNDSNITSCNAGVSVTGTGLSHEIGGLVGENNDTINTCYSTGTVTGGDESENIGGLAGSNKGNIENCQSVSVSVNGGASSSSIGGLAGTNIETITGCSASGTIQGGADSDTIGGLVGENYGSGGSIFNCTATCTVTGSSGSTELGGLVGENESPALVTACHSDGTITGGDTLGGLVGRNAGTISRSLSSSLVTGPDTLSTFGGLVGYNIGTITKSCALGSVGAGSSTTNIGGLAGTNSTGGSVSSCYSTAAVSGENSAFRIGGLIGYIAGGSIADCYSGGTVSGGEPSYYLGGLVGYFNSGTATVNNCYATGAVSGQTGSLYLGGLIGVFVTGTMSNSFWDTQTTLMTSATGAAAGTLINVLGKTTGEMKTQSTYTAYGWDYLGETTNGSADIWRMCLNNVNYPKLSWQHIQIGDFACPDSSNTDDLQRLSEDWLLSYSTDLYGADATGDKSVNLNDFVILAQHWLN